MITNPLTYFPLQGDRTFRRFHASNELRGVQWRVSQFSPLSLSLISNYLSPLGPFGFYCFLVSLPPFCPHFCCLSSNPNDCPTFVQLMLQMMLDVCVSQACCSVYQGECRVEHVCTSQLVSMVTAIWPSLCIHCLCVCVCADSSMSVLEFSACCCVISLLHIFGNVRWSCTDNLGYATLLILGERLWTLLKLFLRCRKSDGLKSIIASYLIFGHQLKVTRSRAVYIEHWIVRQCAAFAFVETKSVYISQSGCKTAAFVSCWVNSEC